MYVQSTGITAGGNEAKECDARYDYRVVLTAGKGIDQPEQHVDGTDRRQLAAPPAGRGAVAPPIGFSGLAD